MGNDVNQIEAISTGPQGTRILSRAHIDAYITNRKKKSHDSLKTHSGAVLVGVNGSVRNRRFNIPAGRSTVGRSGNNDIVIDDESVSLVHARLIQKDREWWVLNLLSTNGTFVNDKKVTDCPLHDGDRLHFGTTEFIFHNPEPLKRSIVSRLKSLSGRIRSLLQGGRKTADPS